MKTDKLYKQYVKHYLRNRPHFFSLLRPQEAYWFAQYEKLWKGPILDFGCGDGFFAEMIWGRGKIDIGLDVHGSRADEAERDKIYKKVVWYDGVTIPFPDNHFKTVVSNCVFEHLPDLSGNVAEMYRVLKPGGYLLTTVMADKWEDYMFGSRVAGDLYRSWMRRKQEHLNLLTMKQWNKTFEKSGFKIEKTIGYLSEKNSLYLDLFHYLSFPSIPSYALTKKWILWPQIAELPGLVDWIGNITEPPKKPEQSAALFFVLKK